jgi:hypothetical protein
MKYSTRAVAIRIKASDQAARILANLYLCMSRVHFLHSENETVLSTGEVRNVIYPGLWTTRTCHGTVMHIPQYTWMQLTELRVFTMLMETSNLRRKDG